MKNEKYHKYSLIESVKIINLRILLYSNLVKDQSILLLTHLVNSLKNK